MRSGEEVVCIIEENGEDVRIEGVGIAGPDCERLTKPLEDALGGGVVKRVKKPEYHKTVTRGRKAVR